MEERTEYLIAGIGAVLLSFGIILFLFLGYYMYAEDAGVPKDTLRNILGANVVGWMLASTVGGYFLGKYVEMRKSKRD